MDETINVNRPVNNSFYDAIVQDIVEWEKENAQKEEEDMAATQTINKESTRDCGVRPVQAELHID